MCVCIWHVKTSMIYKSIKNINKLVHELICKKTIRLKYIKNIDKFVMILRICFIIYGDIH